MFKRVLLCIALLAGAVSTATIFPSTAHAAVDTSSFADEIYAMLNASRASAGLRPLTRSATLDAGATQWSQHMAGGGCTAGGKLICHRTKAAIEALAKSATAPNKTGWWAENVQYAWGPNVTPQSMTRSLLGSPGHRANIMRPDTNMVGIGVAIGPTGAIFVTHNFAQSKAAPAPTSSHPCGKVTSTFSYGSRGAKVRVLQCALAGLGFYVGPINGQFAKNLRAAVKAYQASKGLKPTGSANLGTRRALGISK